VDEAKKIYVRSIIYIGNPLGKPSGSQVGKEQKCHGFLTGTRYLVILPIIGLAIATSFFFVFGGIG
jgi:hypothetical protein